MSDIASDIASGGDLAQLYSDFLDARKDDIQNYEDLKKEASFEILILKKEIEFFKQSFYDHCIKNGLSRLDGKESYLSYIKQKSFVKTIVTRKILLDKKAGFVPVSDIPKDKLVDMLVKKGISEEYQIDHIDITKPSSIRLYQNK